MNRTFSPGFRLSWLDGLILLVGGITAGLCGTIHLWLGLGIAFVVGHFFLFCNVLRMSRPLELVWAAGFASLSLAASCDAMHWTKAFGLSAILTLILATIESQRPSYHGVGWKYLNPQLPDWWKRQTEDVETNQPIM